MTMITYFLLLNFTPQFASMFWFQLCHIAPGLTYLYVVVRQEYHENDQSPQREEAKHREAEASEQPDEEVNEEEPVDKDETQPKEEEAELPPLISTDDTDDLLVCFWLGGNGMNV